MRTLAGWCVRHRRIVLLLWAVVLVTSLTLVIRLHADYSNNFNFPHTESSDAINLLKSVAPGHSGDTEEVVFGTSSGTSLNDPAVGQRINTMVHHINALPNVTHVTSPFDSSGNLVNTTNINANHTVGFIQVPFDKLPNNISQNEATKFVHTVTSTSGSGLTVSVTGQLAEFANNQSFSSSGLGVLLALVVLLLVFGSVFAALLPIISALFALGTAIGIIGLLSHVIGMPEFSPELVLLIGLGVGVDYALFIVTRHRQGLVAGLDTEGSIVNSVNTSGRAVLFAGIIVCIALLGMFALGVSFLYGLAVAAAIGVAFTMISALTLLPAMLGFIGPKVMSRKQKRNLAQNGPRIVGADGKGFWPNWADRVQRYPWLSAGVALIVIVVIAIPFFSLRLGSADQGTDPAGTPTRVAFDTLSQGFGPGFNGPLLLVSVVQPDQHGVINTVVHDVSQQPDVAKVAQPLFIPSKSGGGDVMLLNVYPKTAPQDVATTDLVNHLRSDTLPQAVGNSGVKVLVGGTTAIFIDFANVLSSKLPLFIGLVVLLSFLLLMTIFRSFVIPLTAAVMNLLSIGAAFGILVAVFEWGYGGSLIGLTGTSPIEAFLPVMLFAILFGLSMDYQVFLVSRMHEEYIKSGGNNRVAVRNGLAATGKTITAAALIMILVFGSFILGGERVIKEFGIGLAAGILVDAVFIRMAIVPSLMIMFGDSNWWFPKWLDRALPKLSVDADDLTTHTVDERGPEPERELAGAGKP
ncbi:MAG TPA: MMPL family transporter [Acidimicrobiales bacterium]|jgi:RND superfamily putative drug exporter|nr:MMPL family transporter [Acidimicrobiales bacterium]